MFDDTFIRVFTELAILIAKKDANTRDHKQATSTNDSSKFDTSGAIDIDSIVVRENRERMDGDKNTISNSGNGIKLLPSESESDKLADNRSNEKYNE